MSQSQKRSLRLRGTSLSYGAARAGGRAALYHIWKARGLAGRWKTGLRLGWPSRPILKSGKAMKLGGEPNNWIGLGLLLFLIAAISLGVHWLNLPKPPV